MTRVLPDKIFSTGCAAKNITIRRIAMSIDFNCPACKKPYRVQDELAGKTAKCVCGRRLQIPAPSSEPTDLSDLLDEVAERPKKPAPPPSASKPDNDDIRWLVTGGIAFLPLHRILKRARSPWVKLAIGGAAGALLGLGTILTDMGPAFTLGTSAAGVVAAGLFIVADSVGKRSPALRWLTLIGLLILIVAAVLGYFILEEYLRQQHLPNKHA